MKFLIASLTTCLLASNAFAAAVPKATDPTALAKAANGKNQDAALGNYYETRPPAKTVKDDDPIVGNYYGKVAPADAALGNYYETRPNKTTADDAALGNYYEKPPTADLSDAALGNYYETKPTDSVGVGRGALGKI